MKKHTADKLSNLLIAILIASLGISLIASCISGIYTDRVIVQTLKAQEMCRTDFTEARIVLDTIYNVFHNKN